MSGKKPDIRVLTNRFHADKIKTSFDEYVSALELIRSSNDPDGPCVDMIQACEAMAA